MANRVIECSDHGIVECVWLTIFPEANYRPSRVRPVCPTCIAALSTDTIVKKLSLLHHKATEEGIRFGISEYKNKNSVSKKASAVESSPSAPVPTSVYSTNPNSTGVCEEDQKLAWLSVGDTKIIFDVVFLEEVRRHSWYLRNKNSLAAYVGGRSVYLRTLIYKLVGNEVPAGHIVVAKNGDISDCTMANTICVPRKGHHVRRREEEDKSNKMYSDVDVLAKNFVNSVRDLGRLYNLSYEDTETVLEFACLRTIDMMDVKE